MAVRRRCAGSTLAEVLVAIMIIGIAASGVASVLLQNSQQGQRLSLREKGTMQGEMVLQMLRGYVTADASAATQAAAPFGCWNFRDPANPAVCPAGWALAAGPHDVTYLLAPEFRDPPVAMTLTYTVSATNPPDVRVTTTWQDQ